MIQGYLATNRGSYGDFTPENALQRLRKFKHENWSFQTGESGESSNAENGNKRRIVEPSAQFDDIRREVTGFPREGGWGLRPAANRRVRVQTFARRQMTPLAVLPLISDGPLISPSPPPARTFSWFGTPFPTGTDRREIRAAFTLMSSVAKWMHYHRGGTYLLVASDGIKVTQEKWLENQDENIGGV